MKTFTRVIAVIMMVAILASLMAACGKPYIDQKLVGTWKQEDDVDGNWTWTFNDDNTCKLVGENSESEGTYTLEGESSSKMTIKLSDWSEEQLFTYVATSKALVLQSLDSTYYCEKQ